MRLFGLLLTLDMSVSKGVFRSQTSFDFLIEVE